MSTARPLARALVFTLVAHGLAMVGMVALLLPGMPGGPRAAVADRAAYVAAHPWAWRTGWLGWQVTAAANLLLAAALVRTRWIPRAPAVLALLLTLATLVPDQYGQAMWTWPGVRLAGRGAAAYAPFESHAMRLVAGYGSIGYIAVALCWTWAFAAAGTWSRRLTRESAVAWPLFAASTAALFWPGKSASMALVTSAGNAIAFVVLMAWLAEVTLRVWRRANGRAGDRMVEPA